MACLSSIPHYFSAFVHPVVKKFLVVLAVLTVGAVQLFGARIGYLCGCTGIFHNKLIVSPRRATQRMAIKRQIRARPLLMIRLRLVGANISTTRCATRCR